MAPGDSIFPQPDILNEHEFGRFVLANLAAKRARQIKDGAPPLVRIDSSHPLSIALAEIAAGKIKPVFPDEAEAVEDGTLDMEIADTDGLLLPSLGDSELSYDDVALESDAGDDGAVSVSPASLLSDLLIGDEAEEETEATDADGNMSLDDLVKQEEAGESKEG
ncbi:MAG: DNA-directed RNA polymerase subunit omega [Armatimonadetes bacterium]|nr:DNA-directed RNA polymerase subunit omega [Armatimonadota bacterium]